MKKVCKKAIHTVRIDADTLVRKVASHTYTYTHIP